MEHAHTFQWIDRHHRGKPITGMNGRRSCSGTDERKDKSAPLQESLTRSLDVMGAHIDLTLRLKLYHSFTSFKFQASWNDQFTLPLWTCRNSVRMKTPGRNLGLQRPIGWLKFQYCGEIGILKGQKTRCLILRYFLISVRTSILWLTDKTFLESINLQVTSFYPSKSQECHQIASWTCRNHLPPHTLCIFLYPSLEYPPMHLKLALIYNFLVL